MCNWPKNSSPLLLFLLLLLLFSVSTEALRATPPPRISSSTPALPGPVAGGVALSGIPATDNLPQDYVVHRPKVPAETSSSAPLPTKDPVAVLLPGAKGRAVDRNRGSAFVGDHRQRTGGLLLGQGSGHRGRSFGMQAISNIVCYFARHGLWPRYPQRMQAQVQQSSRQLFELDDNQVRIFCRPLLHRPPPQGGPQGPQFPGGCCWPQQGCVGWGCQGSTSTTTADPNTEYEYYTGTGEGSYTGEEEDYGSAREEETRAGRKTRATDTRTGDEQHKRPIRSLRHKDIVVSFAEWRRTHQ